MSAISTSSIACSARRSRGSKALPEALEEAEIPAEWLKKLAEKYLTEEERQKLEALGWDKLMETLREAPREQKGRHQGGTKWIGTAGTSPFGAYGYNPEGIRIGQDGNRNFRAVKVWDKREFKDLDGEVELGTRNIKIALRRLRKFARTGAAEELDLDTTIKGTAGRAISTSGCVRSDETPSRCSCSSISAARWIGTSSCRGIVLGRQGRVQAHGAFLLPQLPLRAPVEGEPAAAHRSHRDFGCASYLSP